MQREEFEIEENPPFCAHKGCDKPGLYPAPKTPQSAGDFYRFCLQHVREYNARWDYLGGLSARDIEKQIRESAVWERPTWPFGRGPMQKAPPQARRRQEIVPAPVLAALVVLGLSHPVTFTQVKVRHRRLAKATHPDALGGSRAGIERFHEVQQAFTTLSAYYAKQKKTEPLKDA